MSGLVDTEGQTERNAKAGLWPKLHRTVKHGRLMKERQFPFISWHLTLIRTLPADTTRVQQATKRLPGRVSTPLIQSSRKRRKQRGNIVLTKLERRATVRREYPGSEISLAFL